MKEEFVQKINLSSPLYDLMKKLYPICRSITGEGVRETLNVIKEFISIKISEIPTGTKVFDWTVPKEWNIKDAYIKNSSDEKIIDFKNSNLHVLNYSVPINKKMSLDELRPHLFSLPEHPDWIPYLTSYYNENWGFCLSHNQYKSLPEDTYEVVIDSSLNNGFLNYGELFIEGETKEEILFTSYICHPSSCNDSLSGAVLLTFLADILRNKKLKYSYRFLFIPETIGAITWLSLNEKKILNIKRGILATCVGDRGNLTYKKTRIKNSFIDKVVDKVLFDSEDDYKTIEFSPWGSDERQFSSPAFNIELGSLMRTPYGCFSEYHTSADNLDFISGEALNDSLEKYLDIVFILENEDTLVNLNPKCEPQLGKRGLYTSIGGKKYTNGLEEAILWILNLSDGENSLLDISIRSGLKFKVIVEAANLLKKHNLLIQTRIVSLLENKKDIKNIFKGI